MAMTANTVASTTTASLGDSHGVTGQRNSLAKNAKVIVVKQKKNSFPGSRDNAGSDSADGGCTGRDMGTLTSTASSTAASRRTIQNHHNDQHHQFGHYNNSSSVELYFAWFSAVLFIGELVTDVCVAAYFFSYGYDQRAVITLAIIIIPLVLCQIYSVILMRSDATTAAQTHHETLHNPAAAVCWHIFLMGIPYRYQNLFFQVHRMSHYEFRFKVQELQAIQTINAILQYCPQCIFQTFLIVHRNFASLLTAVSAGLAGFAFAWHLFLQCYSLAQRGQEEYKITAGPNFSSNLRVNNLESNNSSSLATIITTASTVNGAPGATVDAAHHNQGSEFATNLAMDPESSLKKNLKILEKNSLMDNRNLAPQTGKSVDKVKLFQFNKRKPICHDDALFIDAIGNDSECLQKSTIYYEVEEDLVKPKCDMATVAAGTSCDDLRTLPQLKRKGICSSQEMLHLVDLMNDNISADQIDTLERSLMDLNGGMCATEEGHLHRLMHKPSASVSTTAMGQESSLLTDKSGAKIFKGFPESLDESSQSSILENIDAAIYENQIIFQERIKKNQLTIQNLKLQDQMLSQFMDLNLESLLPQSATNFGRNDLRSFLIDGHGDADEGDEDEDGGSSHRRRLTELAAIDEELLKKGDPNTSMGYLSTRDYENMCFVNIARNVHKLKHWRNYIQNMHTSQHDNSTVQNSSFFVNTTATTTSNSLYTNTNHSGSGGSGAAAGAGRPSTSAFDVDGDGGAGLAMDKVDDLYMTMHAPVATDKNILVETINQINEESPLKRNGHEMDLANGYDLMALECDGVGKQGANADAGAMKMYPGFYYYAMGGNMNGPLDSILESNCEDM